MSIVITFISTFLSRFKYKLNKQTRMKLTYIFHALEVKSIMHKFKEHTRKLCKKCVINLEFFYNILTKMNIIGSTKKLMPFPHF
jgi:hypothetical protein